ncbi:MAG: S-layer homology domain-containing protein [Oscillospiraceae bacterium]|jgi:hypothetical protein|nr:S-layer homology domain-containing protein [Oscillospiraceae bacterium]
MNIRKYIKRLLLSCVAFGCLVVALAFVSPQNALADTTVDGFTYEIIDPTLSNYFVRITAAPANVAEATIPDFVVNGVNRYFVTEVVITSDKLTYLDVSECSALKYLDCSGCSNLSAITFSASKNEALEYLYCQNCSLTSLDLSGLKRLIWINCSDNLLTSLDTSKNPRLAWIAANNNKLAGLKLTLNTEIEKVECINNKIKKIELSNQLTKLRKLDVRQNCLGDDGFTGLDADMLARLALHFEFYCTAAAGTLDSKCAVVHGYYNAKQYPKLANVSDVSCGAWYTEFVSYAYENGIMVGTSDSKFSPEDTFTRAQIVTVLYRIAGSPKVSGITSGFTDVAANSWYEKYIIWAVSNKIVNGYGDGVFGPDDPVTREQFALILFNYAKTKDKDTSARVNSKFVDAADISSWAEPAVSWCAARGIITGDNNKNFNPGKGATRAEAATMFCRFIENILR